MRKPEIYEHLGVSRSPVPDAVARLAADRLVDVVPQAGTFCGLSVDVRNSFLLPDMTMTLVAMAELSRPNTGGTLDFCHMLFAGKRPCKAAMLVARCSRTLGVHLNGGYGNRDDGLIAQSVHPVQTVKLYVTLM